MAMVAFGHPDGSRACRRRRRGGGFSFTEVLFAVMVLGIGFIMVAAMFPVTISQTQATMRESVGANIARAAIDYLQSPGVATADNFPVTIPKGKNVPAQVLSMPQAFNNAKPPIQAGWLATRDNYICAQDPRYAWVPLYMRGRLPNGADSPYAQVFVVIVQSRNRPEYIPQRRPLPSERYYSDVTLPHNGEPWTALEPHKIQGDPSKPANGVSLKYNYTTLRGEMTFGPDCRHLAAAGAYVIIADDRNKKPPKNVEGQSNGRIYRLGNPADEVNGVWELAPDGDMIRANYTNPNPSGIVAGDDNDLVATDTDAYIIGRGFLDPNPDPLAPPPPPGTPMYGGPAQEIGIYTGFIRISDLTPPGGP